MIYDLTCGDCGAQNLVDSDFPVTRWVCLTCSGSSLTSLPTTDGHSLVVDVNATESLVAVDDTGIADPIVVGTIGG